jgi:hypothetical protein
MERVFEEVKRGRWKNEYKRETVVTFRQPDCATA